MTIEYPNLLERDPSIKRRLNGELLLKWTEMVAASFIRDVEKSSFFSTDEVVRVIQDRVPNQMQDSDITTSVGIVDLMVLYPETNGTTPASMEYSFPYANEESRDFIVQVVTEVVRKALTVIAQSNSKTNQAITEILTQFPDANRAFMLGDIYVPVLIDGPFSIVQALLILNNGTLNDADETIISGLLLDFTRRMRVGVLGSTASAGWVFDKTLSLDMKGFAKIVVERMQLEKKGRYKGYVDDVCLATHPTESESQAETILELLALQFVLPIIKKKAVI